MAVNEIKDDAIVAAGRMRLLPPLRLSRWRALPVIAALCLIGFVLMALFATWLAPYDPLAMSTAMRLKPASELHLLGTDAFGRDLLSRCIYGARVSLIMGVGVAIIAIAIGLPLGLAAGFFRILDAILMRVMDGLMAIPALLLAIAVVSLSGSSIWTVMIAITIPEVPRVVRLVRSVVLSAREEPYVEAAISLGTSLPKIMWRHLMPNTLAPLIVQGTYICASAILIEAILSFLGAGLGTETPSWGNIMSEGRAYFQLKPSLIFWPGLMLSLCILSINLLGDAARDVLDPRLKQRGAE
jgi:peptide/nickel transport system permease protein